MEDIRAADPNRILHSLQPKVQRFGWLILVSCTLFGFWLVNYALSGLVPANLSLYLLQPLFWTSIAVLVFFFRFVEGERVPLLENKDLLLSAGMIGGVQVAVSILFGLLSGFGESPYARGMWMVALNLWFIATRLAGLEAARWYLGVTIGKKSHALGFLIAWLLPLVLIIPFGKYSLLGESMSAARVAGETLLPAASENLLAAFLAISGGPLASIAYRGVLAAFEWLFPILPDLPWMAAAFVGVLVPALGLIALNRQEADPGETRSSRKPGEERASAASWLVVGALAVGVIWLNSGALGVRPSLISGNSMNPALYAGDVILTREISPEKIQVGDVIRFPRDGMDFVHRVKYIHQDGGQTVFTTRGDNNNVDDEPVVASLVEGKVVLTVPKIGWISIYLRQAISWVGGVL